MVNQPLVKKPAPNYWIEGGMKVQILGGYGPVMEVMRVLQVRRKLKSGIDKTYIEGVLCVFKDPYNGKEVKKRFHTRELQPARQ